MRDVFKLLLAYALVLSSSFWPGSGTVVAAPTRAEAIPELTTLQPTSATITGSPLGISVFNDLSMAVSFNGARQFFSNTAAGTFIDVGGTIYGTDPPASSALQPRPLTPVANNLVGGTGTTGDPFAIVSIVDIGATGIRLTQTTTYVNGQPIYRIDYQIENQNATAQSIRIFHAADLFLNFPGNTPDFGFGFFDPATGAVGATSLDSLNVQTFIPITPASAFQEAFYNTLWGQIGDLDAQAGPGFNNTVNSRYHDIAAGLQWDQTIEAQSSTTISFYGGFGLAADVGVTPGPVDAGDDNDPAEVSVVVRPDPNHTVAAGSVLICNIVIVNSGSGLARNVRLNVPFNPAAVTLLDASFSNESAWVSELALDYVTVETGRLGSGGDTVTATLQLQVNQNAPPGERVVGQVAYEWSDDADDGASLSNTPILVVGDRDDDRDVYRMEVSPPRGPAGTVHLAQSGLYAADEPIGIWFNVPDGSVLEADTLRAEPDGSLLFEFSTAGFATGDHTIVFYGHWTGFSSVGVFAVDD